MTTNTDERKLLFMMNAEQAESFARLLGAAEQGDGGAACMLGDMYREGSGGLRYSPKATHLWYARSALAGDANGQNNLGACYEHGLGCRQSYGLAVKWYRLAVAQRIGTASMNLGYCYLRGHAVPADKVEALRLFRQAVEWGEPKAVPEVERLAGPMTAPMEPAVRDVVFVDETEPGERLGFIGVGGGECEVGPDRPALTAEKWRDRELRAYTKDDCFDMPEPGSSADESLQLAVERMKRWQEAHAASASKPVDLRDEHEDA